MQTEAIERVAEEDAAPDLCVVERLHAEVIPRAEEATSRTVPDGECEVAEQAPYALLAPGAVRAEDQLSIWSIRREIGLACPERRDEILPRIDPSVGHNPLAPVERERLLRARGFLGDSQHCVPKTDGGRRLHTTCVRTSKREGRRDPTEQAAVDR